MPGWMVAALIVCAALEVLFISGAIAAHRRAARRAARWRARFVHPPSKEDR